VTENIGREFGQDWAKTAPPEQLARLRNLFLKFKDSWSGYFADDPDADEKSLVDVVDVRLIGNRVEIVNFWERFGGDANPTFVQEFVDGALAA
jgi:hypothetical protein